MYIKISIKDQTLTLFEKNHQTLKKYSISTAKNGIDCKKKSGGTPLGLHIIRAKIGKNAAPNTVFIGRRPTGEVCTPKLMAALPHRDWILTRILWLSGKEVGTNRLGDVDTMQRYIYIHGSPDSVKMGTPGSHGCVRMRNSEIIELFDLVEIGTSVTIAQ